MSALETPTAFDAPPQPNVQSCVEMISVLTEKVQTNSNNLANACTGSSG
jgi:hypothetical protein